MSNLCLVFSTNVMGHGDLSRAGLRKLLDGDLLRIFKAVSQIACSVSIEGIDMEIFSVIKNFVKNSGQAEVISGEYVHAMPDLIFEANPKLAELNLVSGDAAIKHPVRFVTEYCSYNQELARQVVANNGPSACYMMDSATTIYSDNWEGEAVPPSVLFLTDEISAVRNAGITYLRMRSKYFNPILGQWFAFQRYRGAVGEKKKVAVNVVDEMEKQLEVAKRDGVPVIFVPIDIESCVIGSHHGAVIYEEIVASLLGRNLPLIGPKKAFEILAGNAPETERPHRALANMKWVGHSNQESLRRILIEHGRKEIPENCSSAALALIPFISDGFVVCKYAIDSKTTLDADLGPLVIGGENYDILAVQMAALRHFTRGGNFRETIEWHRRSNPDSYLFQAMSLWAENKGI